MPYYQPEDTSPYVRQRARDYWEGRWCGECAYGVVEDPPCCTLPDTAATDD